jgi:diguanylate cyclase (GGDEF)-like protein/PAS domain S-box-containing protein
MIELGTKQALFSRKGWISYLILLFIVAVAGWLATGYLGEKARKEIIENNESKITLYSSRFTAEFENIQRTVKILSGSPWIVQGLASRKAKDIRIANSVLDRYNPDTAGSVSYLMDGKGMTIASSNRNDPDSFVGKSYAFRPYFIQAVKGAPGRYFALGATSLKRGFYASHPVRDGKKKILGVVVIKQNIEEEASRLGGSSCLFLVDPNGVVFLSNREEMNFKSLWPISPETRLALLQSKQFGDQPFDAILSEKVADGTEIPMNGEKYLVSRRMIDAEGWSIVFMATTERIWIYKLAGVILTLWICTMIAVPFIINYRTSRSAEMLRASEIRFRELFNTMNSGVAIYVAKNNGQNFIITDINPVGERISRVKKQDIIGKSILEVFPGAKEFGLTDVMQNVWKTGETKHHPVSQYRDNRISQWVDNNILKLASGEIVAVYDDVTDRKRLEEEILTLSITDQLTGLHNRRGFLSLAGQQLKLSDRNKRGVMLFFADLDGLKWINDTLGHEEGDKALMEAAIVFKETFRTSDIIARLGGDEYAALAVDITETKSEIFTARLQNLVDRKNRQDERRYRLSISVGCSFYDPEHPCSIDELMASADKLMYEEKQNKKKMIQQPASLSMGNAV